MRQKGRVQGARHLLVAYFLALQVLAPLAGSDAAEPHHPEVEGLFCGPTLPLLSAPSRHKPKGRRQSAPSRGQQPAFWCGLSLLLSSIKFSTSTPYFTTSAHRCQAPLNPPQNPLNPLPASRAIAPVFSFGHILAGIFSSFPAVPGLVFSFFSFFSFWGSS